MESTTNTASPIVKGVGPINENSQPCGSVQDMTGAYGEET